MNRNRLFPAFLAFTMLAFASGISYAQLPHIQTLFPIGGKAGTTVEVEVRGSLLNDATGLSITRPGIEGTVDPGTAKVDNTNRPVWQKKCGNCHELRSPANRSLTSEEWGATVERMVNVHNAPISQDEEKQIIEYLQSAAKAGHVTLNLTIPAKMLPGRYEVRLVTTHGLSNPVPFDVGDVPEVMAINNTPDKPQAITLPCAAEGCLQQRGERDCYQFEAVQGKRYIFDLRGFRYNLTTVEFFNPDLRLYDSAGSMLQENHGFNELDPLIDWTCPKNGKYVVEVRDLLGNSNPGSVYRLAMGDIPYKTILYPPGGPVRSHMQVTLVGENVDKAHDTAAIEVPAEEGLTTVSTPWGALPFYATRFPVGSDNTGHFTYRMPTCFSGRLTEPGQKDLFAVSGPGRFDLRAMGRRLGGAIRVQLALLDSPDHVIQRSGDDGRMVIDLPAKKVFAIQVTARDNRVGTDCIYFVSSQPASGYLKCNVIPSSITVRPGATTVVRVQIDRRDDINGDFKFMVIGLPDGVTAEPITHPRDTYRWGIILIHASADAKPAVVPLKIMAEGPSPQGDVVTQCDPMDREKINNYRVYIPAESTVLAVCGPTRLSFTLSESGTLPLSQAEPTQVHIHLNRMKGFDHGLRVRIIGLPDEWYSNTAFVGGGQNDVVVDIYPDNHGPKNFFKRAKDWAPFTVVVQVRDGANTYYSAGTLIAEPNTKNAKLAMNNSPAKP